MSRCIGCDLDGTLAEHQSGDIARHGPMHIGAPIPSTLRRVQQALAQGHDVWIFTARVSPEHGDTTAIVEAIVAWCLQHVGRRLEITAIKLARFDEIWDDKAVRIQKNQGATGFTIETLWHQLGRVAPRVGCSACGGFLTQRGTGKILITSGALDDNCPACGGDGWQATTP